MARTEFDVVVVGASIEGLVAAVTLARARARVVLVERAEEVGGAAAPIGIPGVDRVTACAAMPLVGPFRKRLFEQLRLGRRGVRLLCPDPLAWTPLADGRSLAIRSDAARASSDVAAFSRRDAAVWARFALWRLSLVRRMEPLLRKPRVRIEHVARVFRSDRAALRDVLFGSVAEVAERHFETPALLASIAQYATSGTTLSPRDPGSFFHLVLKNSADLLGPVGAWGHVVGGTGRLARALAEASAEAGVEVRTRTTARAIHVHRGRANGVVLEDGTVVHGRAVLSSLSERTTLLRLLEAGVLSTRTRAAVEARRVQGTTLRMALALDGLPTFAVARPAPGTAALAGVLRTPRTLAELEAACADARAGRPSSRPSVEMTIPSTLDPTLSPPGVHVALVTAHHALPRDSGEEVAERALDVLEEVMPDLRRRMIGRVVLSPGDLEARLGSEGGHPSQGDAVPGRMFSERPAETPLPGLFLCGAAGHPGIPGSGLPGTLAARAALALLRRR